MKKILNRVFFFLPFLFIGLAMLMMIHLGISLKNNDVPNLFNRAILYVKTQSMEDTIMAGDLIFVNVSDKDYNEDDIISFYKPDQPSVIITHRIVSNINGLITTKGDNNAYSESWEINFSEDFVIGKYVGKSALLGSVYEVLFVNSLNVLFGLITIVFLLIGVIEFRNIIKLLSQKKALEFEEQKQKMIEEAKVKIKEEMKDDL